MPLVSLKSKKRRLARAYVGVKVGEQGFFIEGEYV
jgi:hypothetical protein